MLNGKNLERVQEYVNNCEEIKKLIRIELEDSLGVIYSFPISVLEKGYSFGGYTQIVRCDTDIGFRLPIAVCVGDVLAIKEFKITLD